MARRLTDRECPDCQPTGNRFMKHVRTESEPKWGRLSGSPEGFEHIAFFRCINCGTVRTHVLEANDLHEEI